MLLVTSIVAFLLPRLGGGDPAVVVAGSDATTEQVEAIRVSMGLDRPLVIQYVDWLAGVVQGDLGTSLISNRPISQLIMSRLGSTLELAVSATVLMIALGLGLGILAGSVARGPGRVAVDSVVSVLLATPPHVTGLIMILAFGIAWRLLLVQVFHLLFFVMVRIAAVADADIDWDFSLNGWLAVLLAFVLAKVFEHGARLRDDLGAMI